MEKCAKIGAKTPPDNSCRNPKIRPAKIAQAPQLAKRVPGKPCNSPKSTEVIAMPRWACITPRKNSSSPTLLKRAIRKTLHRLRFPSISLSICQRAWSDGKIRDAHSHKMRTASPVLVPTAKTLIRECSGEWVVMELFEKAAHAHAMSVRAVYERITEVKERRSFSFES